MGQKEMWLVAVALTAIMFVWSLAVMFTVVKSWTQAQLLGIPASFGLLVGMRLRRSPVRFLLGTAIVLHNRGQTVPLADVERAYLEDGKRQTSEYELAELVIQGRQPPGGSPSPD